MVQVMPWLLEREYQQHRNLDYYGLPETFAAWQELASALAGKLSRVTGWRVVKVVIHPGELEEWARRKGRPVDARVRSDFAGTLWRTENAYLADPISACARALTDPSRPEAAPRRRRQVVAIHYRLRASGGLTVAQTIRAARNARLRVR